MSDVVAVVLAAIAAGVLAGVGVVLTRRFGPRPGVPQPPHPPAGPVVAAASSSAPAAGPHVGATEAYARELHAQDEWESLLAGLVEDLACGGGDLPRVEVDLLDPFHREIAEDVLRMRLAVEEDIEHFGQRVDRILDAFAGAGWRDTAVVPVPTAHDFAQLRELVAA